MEENSMKNAGMKKICRLGGWLFVMACAAAPLTAGASDYLLPQSNSEYLDTSDVAGFSQQYLNYARNEIYARRGRLFNSQELMEYFNLQDWYNGTISPSDFDENTMFNEYERSNAHFLWNLEYGNDPDGYALDQPGYDIYAVAGYEEEESVSEETKKAMYSGEIMSLGRSFSLDLNGDGTEEQIRMGAETRHTGWDDTVYVGSYVLQVGSQFCEGSGDNIHWNVYGVSLDGKQILLMLFDEGPSDDPKSTFFYYDGSSLKSMGTIPEWYESMEIYEDGTIGASIRCDVMDTSRIETLWKVNDQMELVMLAQDYYEMHNYSYYYGNDTNEYYTYLTRDLDTYQEMDTSSVMITMEPQYVCFPYTDGTDWVYVQGEMGSGGWISMADMSWEEKYSTFEGLRAAD